MTFPLEVLTFPGTPNLPLYVGEREGWFEARGLDLRLSNTPSSTEQMRRLIAGEVDIAGTAIDNVIAYVEGQGSPVVPAAPELFAFMGASQIELSLVASPEIATLGDLAGASIALDALDTGFAFVVYRMLEDAGLMVCACELGQVGATPQRLAALLDGTHNAALLLEPFTAQARARGYRVLASSAQVLPRYQGGIFAARREWARAHRAALEGFIAAYLEGLRWVREPANQASAKALLSERIPAIAPTAIDTVFSALVAPATGLTPEAEIDLERVACVLAVRNAYGAGGAPLAVALEDPERYLDLSYYGRARAALPRG